MRSVVKVCNWRPIWKSTALDSDRASRSGSDLGAVKPCMTTCSTDPLHHAHSVRHAPCPPRSKCQIPRRLRGVSCVTPVGPADRGTGKVNGNDCGEGRHRAKTGAASVLWPEAQAPGRGGIRYCQARLPVLGRSPIGGAERRTGPAARPGIAVRGPSRQASRAAVIASRSMPVPMKTSSWRRSPTPGRK